MSPGPMNDLPLSGIGGAGFPTPPTTPGPLPPNMARGVDLSKIKNKARHQHRWIMVANFAVADKLMVTLASTKDQVKNVLAKGGELTPELQEKMNVSIPIDGSGLLNLDGPGCAKCGLHWEHENGYGKLCDVDDQDWTGQTITPAPGNTDVAAAMAEREALAEVGLMSFEDAMAEAEAEAEREEAAEAAEFTGDADIIPIGGKPVDVDEGDASE